MWTTSPGQGAVPPPPERGTLVARARLLTPATPPQAPPAAEPPVAGEPAVATEPLVTSFVPGHTEAVDERPAPPPSPPAPPPAPVIIPEEAPSPIGRLVAVIVSFGLAWALAVAIATWLLVLVASR